MKAYFDHSIQYRITSVALIIEPHHYTSDEAKSSLKQSCISAAKTGVPVHQYEAKTIHQLFQTGKVEKRNLMKALSFLYSELMHLKKWELYNMQKYYHKLFEAMAVAELHSRSKT